MTEEEKIAADLWYEQEYLRARREARQTPECIRKRAAAARDKAIRCDADALCWRNEAARLDALADSRDHR